MREPAKQYSLHPLERTLAALVIALLVFLPWALGCMKLWGQYTAATLAALAFIVALIPRRYDERYHASGHLRLYMFPKLFRFPLFWLGLVYFALIVCQIFNPAWTYRSSSAGWWLESIDYIRWLPHGIEGTPFKVMNGWRTLMIHGAAWLLVCALWVGITRRKTAKLILTSVALNGVLVAIVVILQRITDTKKLLWLWDAPVSNFAAGFIYKNHAGEFLLLIIAICLGLTWWHGDQAKLKFIKSHPGFVFGFSTLLTTAAILLTYARAASVLALLFLAAVILFYTTKYRIFRNGWQLLVIVLLTVVLIGGTLMITTSTQPSGVMANFQKLLTEDRPFSIGWRQQAIVATIDMANDDIILGHGIGGFRYLFPLYQQYYPDIWIGYEWSGDKIVERRLYWEHAHSDYVQFFAESGLIGAALGLLTVIICCVSLKQTHLFQQPSLLIIMGGPGLVAVGALVDFPFHNPAVLFTTVAVLALGLRWAQVARR